MITHKLSLLATLPVAAALIFSTATPAIAQEETRVTITPVTFDLTANSGDTLKEVIKVRNDAPTTQKVTISTENFTAVGEEGKVGLTEEETPFNLASWISFDKESYTLESGEEVQVPFLIRVPFNAEPGGHYASVYAQIGAVSAGEASGSSIGQKVGALILLRVAGDVKESADVAGFKASQSGPNKPVEFAIRVKNEGSVHIRPRGLVSITDLFGNKVTDVQVEEQNVFPGAIRHMRAEWDKAPFIGRYTANVLMYYGQNNQQLTASTTFWIIPWKTLGIVGGVLLVVIVLLYLGRRRIGRSLKALISGK